MKKICTINLNEGTGRQTIYMDDEGILRTDFDDSECYGVPQASVEEAAETAVALWGVEGAWPWELEWCDE